MKNQVSVFMNWYKQTLYHTDLHYPLYKDAGIRDFFKTLFTDKGLWNRFIAAELLGLTALLGQYGWNKSDIQNLINKNNNDVNAVKKEIVNQAKADYYNFNEDTEVTPEQEDQYLRIPEFYKNKPKVYESISGKKIERMVGTEPTEENKPQQIAQPVRNVQKTQPVQPTKHTPKRQKTDPHAKKINEFPYDSFMKDLIKYEGVKSKVYNDGRGNMTIGIGHFLRKTDKKIFQDLLGINPQQFSDITSGKLGLTQQQIEALAKYDIDKHLRIAQKLFPKFKFLPPKAQGALAQTIFRGDTGNRTRSLINMGNWAAAAREYLNRDDYKKAVELGIPGIRPRMERNRDAFLEMANK